MKYLFAVLIITISSLYYFFVYQDNDSTKFAVAENIDFSEETLFADSCELKADNIPNGYYLKKLADNDISFWENEQKVVLKNVLVDDLDFKTTAYLSSLNFHDSLLIKLTPKVIRKKKLYFSFSYFNSDSSSDLIVKWPSGIKTLSPSPNKGGNVFCQSGINLGGFNGKSTIKLLKKGIGNISIYDLKLYTLEKYSWRNKKKKSVLILDIENLSSNFLQDSISFPGLYNLAAQGKTFTTVFRNSPDKNSSLTSFLGGVYPSLIYRKGGTITSTIMENLRKNSLPNIYSKNLYNTHFIAAYDSSEIDGIFLDDFDFSKASIVKNNINADITVTKNLLRTIHQYRNESSFIYVGLNKNSSPDKNNKILKRTDIIVTKIIDYLTEYKILNDYIIVLCSSHNDKFTESAPAVFFNPKGISRDKYSNRADMTDLARTILSFSGLKAPYYFNGRVLGNSENREFIYGSDSICHYILSKDHLYIKDLSKKLSNEHLIKLSPEKKITEEDSLLVVDAMRKKMKNLFPLDFVKTIKFRNRGNSERIFSVNIVSKYRFSTLENLKDYYSNRNRSRSRYRKKLSVKLAPGAEKEFNLFFGRSNQKFDLKFDKKYNLTYGEISLFAGNVRSFFDNSEKGYSMNDDKIRLFKEYDVNIINRKIVDKYDIKE